MTQLKSNTRISRLVLVVLGIALLVVASGFFLAMDEPEVGDVGAIEDSLLGDLPTPGPAGQPASTTTVPQLPDREVDPTPSIEPNTLSELRALASVGGPDPIGLRVDAIEVLAPIEPYGVNVRTGQMDVPRNVTDVAWYEYGPAPGDRGSAVLAAHVDLAGRGPGVFFDLRQLQPGDEIAVSYDDGSEKWFVVRARTTYDKDDLPLDTIFSRQGSPTLTLITCGGGFNDTAQSYDSNVVVYAVPVGSGTENKSGPA